MRRVAITGLGIVSPVGIGSHTFFESLLKARSGIRSVEVKFPTGPEDVLMGSIDFNPDEHFAKAKLLTMDRVSQFALVAAREAMLQAGFGTELTDLQSKRFGVSVGTGSGGAGSLEAAPCG